jgi:hypothetical protein
MAKAREFLSSSAGKSLFDYAMNSCPRLELGKCDRESYRDSLVYESGWRGACTLMQAIVQPVPEPDVTAVGMIDNTF